MEVYGYQYMQGTCNDCKKILEKMKQSIDSFDSATGVYSASIKDKISVAAEKLVEALRDSRWLPRSLLRICATLLTERSRLSTI